MLALRQYRSRSPGFPDLLNWGSMYEAGVVLQKDGSLVAGWSFRGPDTAAASPAERNQVSAAINAAFAGLGSEWMVHVDAIRVPTEEYPAPERSYFPDAVSEAIDDERRRLFQAAGAQYDTRLFLLVTYLPPKLMGSKLAGLALDDADGPVAGSAEAQAMRAFHAGWRTLRIA